MSRAICSSPGSQRTSKDKAPRVVRGADGGDGWSIYGEMPKRTYGLEAMAGYDKKDYRDERAAL